jgi:acyl carrier protein
MMEPRVRAVVDVIASVLKIPRSDIQADSSMETLPEWDSIAHLNICLVFERRFGIAMDMKSIAHSTSVVALVELVPHDRVLRLDS